MAGGAETVGTSAPAARPGAITLARHGRPHADRTVRLDGAGYRHWWAAYDTVGLHPGDDTPPRDIVEAAQRANVLLASGLPRAVATAQAVAPGRPVGIETLFVEAPLPLPPLPRLLQFKPPTWGVLARIIWWLGYSAGQESRAEATDRAERAADLLVEIASAGDGVMVFAHGWFNRMLRPALGRRFYDCVQDGGDSYWSFRTYEHRSLLRQGASFTLPPPADRLAAKGDDQA
jgi:broad specificity phosphatase PhoE